MILQWKQLAFKNQWFYGNFKNKKFIFLLYKIFMRILSHAEKQVEHNSFTY